MLALDIAKKYVTEHLTKQDPYQSGTVEKADRVVLNGNQAVVAGALAAQCRYFAGYPITPASDIMEGLAKELPQVGGTFLQAEDEIAALASVLGASYGGHTRDDGDLWPWLLADDRVDRLRLDGRIARRDCGRATCRPQHRYANKDGAVAI